MPTPQACSATGLATWVSGGPDRAATSAATATLSTLPGPEQGHLVDRDNFGRRRELVYAALPGMGLEGRARRSRAVRNQNDPFALPRVGSPILSCMRSSFYPKINRACSSFAVQTLQTRLYRAEPGSLLRFKQCSRAVSHPIVYWLFRTSSLAHSSATLLLGCSSPGMVAQPCSFT